MFLSQSSPTWYFGYKQILSGALVVADTGLTGKLKKKNLFFPQKNTMPCRHQELRSGRYQLSPNILKKNFFFFCISVVQFFFMKYQFSNTVRRKQLSASSKTLEAAACCTIVKVRDIHTSYSLVLLFKLLVVEVS